MIAIGGRVYGLGVAMLGIVEMAYGGFSDEWLPAPVQMPGYHVLVYASACMLIVAGAAINVTRTKAAAALALAAFFALGVAALHLPHALARPAVWVGWQAVAESTVMTLGGVLAYADAVGGRATRAPLIVKPARCVFGVCLLVFGVSHFVYARFTASLVPAWLPPSQLFWTYATGLAQLAAGLAVLSGVQGRLAAILLTVMYAAFSLLVHIPSLIVAPSSHDNWAENAINLILIGAAWTLAESLSKAEGSTRLERGVHGSW